MESLFFTDPILLSLSLVALFCAVAACFVPAHGPASALAVCGAVLAVCGVTYALLLGASLYETLAFVLMLAAISVLSLLPEGESGKDSDPSGRQTVRTDGTSDRTEKRPSDDAGADGNETAEAPKKEDADQPAAGETEDEL